MSLGLLFVLLLLLCIMFYFIVDGLIAASETRERNQFLEMQESHYHAVQRYMDETARVRHDFKHTIGALSDLAANGEVEAVRKYLEEYLEAQPHSDTVQYCSDTAVNAMLNHYAHRAVDQGIEMNLEIDLPASSSLPSLDQCSILGNILENAIIACGNIPEEERYIDLLIRNDHGQIYIVASNSFDGKVRVKDGRYLTTHHRKGHGIGLSSITSTAEKNGGMVRFSHEGKEFNTDVLLPFRKEK
jgi:sensor histidine kinase regulating citrate/malate metabolism